MSDCMIVESECAWIQRRCDEDVMPTSKSLLLPLNELYD